jgi:hypothetical protein
MSATSSSQDSREHPEVQEPEGLPTVRAVVIGLIFLVIFALATFWSVQILRTEERKIGVAEQTIPTPQEIGKPQIGIVNQRLFDLQLEAKRKRDEQLARLNGYGWVDRDKQIIHIPIDQAMEKLAREPRR